METLSPLYIVLLVAAGVGMLLLMVLKFRLSAFVSLLITSMAVGLLAGMPGDKVLKSIQEGMGSTLGFIATVVGLGAIFGQLLESSGGARALSGYLLSKFGKERASWALMLSGFIIAIPIFFDVGFIILIPVVYSLSRDAGKSVLYYGLSLLAGLAVAHTLVPPTPGPMAVAQILNADIGWVVLFGILVGLPAAALAGPVFGKYIAKKIFIAPPNADELAASENDLSNPQLPGFLPVLLIILTPLLLIIAGTLANLFVGNGSVKESLITQILIFLGHPFSALIIATLLAILLCLRRKMNTKDILNLSNKALGPAGIIILVTGAGGVLKQILVDSGIGKVLADYIAGSPFPIILLAWILAAVVRVTQGSATVAMITAASIIAPIIGDMQISQPKLALIVISIASGATILSHVNDSGFWIVSKYLGLNEKQTLRTWTVMETVIAVVGLVLTLIASLFVK
jgi:Gnt-I system low-affinity gluconate transporter